MDNKFKVRCTWNDGGIFTVGKIYEWCDGNIKDDDGYVYSIACRGDDVTRWSFLLSKFEKVTESADKIIITHDGITTTAKLYDGKNLIKSATAKCAPDDTFDFATGAMLVLDRICKSSEVREVKRPAKVGEWIKIVKANLMEGCYQNGDVLQVIDTSGEKNVYVRTKLTHSVNRGDNTFCVYINEYVVLENYTPPAEPTKHEYKAGNLAKVVGNTAGHNFPLNTIIRLSNDFGSTGCSAEFLDKSDWWGVHYSDIEPFDGRIKQ